MAARKHRPWLSQLPRTPRPGGLILASFAGHYEQDCAASDSFFVTAGSTLSAMNLFFLSLS